MQSTQNSTVTFLALQRLTEQAWDENDAQRLTTLTAAVDAFTIAALAQGLRALQPVKATP